MDEPQTLQPTMAAAPRELLMDAVIAPKLSFATHQNDVPVIRELKLVNLGDPAVEQVVLTIAADPPVFAPREWRFDRIAAGGEVHVTQRDLPLNAAALLQLTEAVRASITLQARCEGDATMPQVERRVPVELLARNEWAGRRRCRNCWPPSPCPTIPPPAAS